MNIFSLLYRILEFQKFRFGMSSLFLGDRKDIMLMTGCPWPQGRASRRRISRPWWNQRQLCEDGLMLTTTPRPPLAEPSFSWYFYYSSKELYNALTTLWIFTNVFIQRFFKFQRVLYFLTHNKVDKVFLS